MASKKYNKPSMNTLNPITQVNYWTQLICKLVHTIEATKEKNLWKCCQLVFLNYFYIGKGL